MLVGVLVVETPLFGFEVCILRRVHWAGRHLSRPVADLHLKMDCIE